jgi:S-adenosylmethionine:tRNA ribosyltransferase-isomerase
MNTNLYDYILPEELIALTPKEKRDTCRLMVVDKENGDIKHAMFSDITGFLNKGDVLVLNDTKVLHARLYGKRKTGSLLEILLLESSDLITWKVLTNKSGRLKIGEEIEITGEVEATLLEKQENGIKFLKFNTPLSYELLEKIGNIPLPPYINKKRPADENDKNWYQCVFAKKYGSMACPTAGLHLTEKLLDKIKSKGIEVVYITLHVSLSTFNPIKEDNIENHTMHDEFYSVSKNAADVINLAKSKGNKIFAVGTTVVRTLEAASEKGMLENKSGFTKIYIKPGYNFKVCDAIITNFHTPKSTLLVLISAFAGIDIIKNAYQKAIEDKYRFLSYGDAMLIR